MAGSDQDWYKHALIYQIYPRSFADANGDGVGDLAGITSKLDYLRELQVDAIWLSPIYQSPMADFGYDVSDYQAIDPVFGDLADFDRLLAAAHERGIKVLMDLIPNHTSNQHRWFLESSSSIDNPKRNWYIWKDAKTDGSPPNNWQSVFGGPAWTYDTKTAQYYLHSFLKEQPDLNWSNPEVQEAIRNIMRFWYERGVDGFRVDAILFTSKDLEFRDNPEPSTTRHDVLDDEFETAFSHGVGKNLPDYIHVLTDVAHEYTGRCVFLEAYPDKGEPAGYAHLYDFIDHAVSAPFYFGIFAVTEEWKAKTFKRVLGDFLDALPSDAFSAFVLGNHDISRLATRIGAAQARAAAVALLTLPGAKFIYYGEELGMEDVTIPPALMQDPSNVPRDPERTPMPWDGSQFGGFSNNQPWLPLGPTTSSLNVETQTADDHSMLQLYKQLARLAKSQPALMQDTFEIMDIESDAVAGFRRTSAAQRLIVLINFTGKPASIQTTVGTGTILLSSTLTNHGMSGNLEYISLEPYEAVVIELA